MSATLHFRLNSSEFISRQSVSIANRRSCQNSGGSSSSRNSSTNYHIYQPVYLTDILYSGQPSLFLMPTEIPRQSTDLDSSSVSTAIGNDSSALAFDYSETSNTNDTLSKRSTTATTAKSRQQMQALSHYFEEYRANNMKSSSSSPTLAPKKKRTTMNSRAAEQIWVPDLQALDAPEISKAIEEATAVASGVTVSTTDSEIIPLPPPNTEYYGYLDDTPKDPVNLETILGGPVRFPSRRPPVYWASRGQSMDMLPMPPSDYESLTLKDLKPSSANYFLSQARNDSVDYEFAGDGVPSWQELFYRHHQIRKKLSMLANMMPKSAQSHERMITGGNGGTETKTTPNSSPPPPNIPATADHELPSSSPPSVIGVTGTASSNAAALSVVPVSTPPLFSTSEIPSQLQPVYELAKTGDQINPELEQSFNSHVSWPSIENQEIQESPKDNFNGKDADSENRLAGIDVLKMLQLWGRSYYGNFLDERAKQRCQLGRIFGTTDGIGTGRYFSGAGAAGHRDSELPPPRKIARLDEDQNSVGRMDIESEAGSMMSTNRDAVLSAVREDDELSGEDEEPDHDPDFDDEGEEEEEEEEAEESE